MIVLPRAATRLAQSAIERDLRRARIADRERILGLWLADAEPAVPTDVATVAVAACGTTAELSEPSDSAAVRDIHADGSSIVQLLNVRAPETAVHICAMPESHLRHWRYRLADRRFVCELCHPPVGVCSTCQSLAWTQRCGRCGNGWYCAVCH